MRAMALLMALAAPAGPPPAVDVRIHEAAIAAQALHGPLDGAWILRDGQGRTLYLFELADPVGAGADLQGAWRDPRRPDDLGALGVLNSAHRAADLGLRLSFDAGGARVEIKLRESAPSTWRGEMREGAAARWVALERP